MKFFLFFALLMSSLFSSSIENLYTQAKEHETKKEYKNAMEVYKKIALELSNKDTIPALDYQFLDSNKVLNTIDDNETIETIEQIVSSRFNLYPYKENYFFLASYDNEKKENREQTEAKLQFSIKKPFRTNLFGFDETIYFGYTQVSWWQIYSDSSPFRETNYKPEIFITLPYGKKDHTSLKAMKLGFLHESNGRSDDNSRSWNSIYVESYFQFSSLFVIPKVWYRIPESKDSDDNPDLMDYLGYGDITLLYPYKDQTFKLLHRNNLKFNHNNKSFTQLDWTFPFFTSKNTFGYIQLSNGYGESLIDYDKEISRFNFGISLSR